MKKLLFMSLAAIAIIVCMVNCGGSAQTPSSIAQDCIEYMKNGDFEAYVETLNVSKEEKAQLLLLIREKGKKELEKKQGIVGYQILSEEISEDGKKAVVKAEIEYGNGKKKNEKFHFELIDGEWKQVLNK